MKMIKTALLATAAVAAVSTVARADELSDLKAQIEALNARISQVEAAPSVPAGYQMVSISKQKAIVVPTLEVDGDALADVTTFSVLPAADAPASTNVQWSGHVRAALAYTKRSGNTPAAKAAIAASSNPDLGKDFDVVSRARLNMTATTDTAVGEVGVKMDFEADYKGMAKTGWGVGDYWGYWNFAEGMSFGGGFTGTLAEIGAGGGSFELAEVQGLDLPGGTSQFRLGYSSGPLAFAVALEDGTVGAQTDDAMGVAGEVKYTSDIFGVELAGGVWSDERYVFAAANPENGGVKNQIGLGLTTSFDPVKLGMGAVMGKRFDGQKFWTVRGSADVALAEGISASIAASRHSVGGNKENQFAAGLYWSPVSQLKLGLEGGYATSLASPVDHDRKNIDFVAKYSF